jgi:hypothetical protein
MRKKHLTVQILLTMLVILAGCGGPGPKPQTATTIAAPKQTATRTITSFTPALRCMDDLLLSYGKKGFVITTAGIPDETGKVRFGTKTMLHKAASAMSTKSKSLVFIDYDTTSQDLLNIFHDVSQVNSQRQLPQYYIRGAISQLDENVITAQQGGGIATSFIDLGGSNDQISSVVSIDMNIGNTVTREILPGIDSTNSLVVSSSGSSKDLGGKIGKVGLSFSMSMKQSEGMGAGVRALIELGMIELVGKLLEVPYWKCLGVEKTNPMMQQQAQDFYDGMSAQERIKFVQQKLKGAGLYSGAVSGADSAELTTAIGKFQGENGLIADGRINFDLYYALLDSNIKSAPDPTDRPQTLVADTSGLPIGVTISSDTNGQYKINDTLTAQVQTTGDGFLYCYYQDITGAIARIFPNRFHPNPVIKSNSVMSLPAESSPFKIKFDQAGGEKIVCYASSRDMVVPPAVKGDDLTPLQVRSMDEIGNAFRQSNPQLAESTLDIVVR